MKLSSLLKRLWIHVSPRRRKQLGLLLLLIIITSFTDVVAIGAVLPFLAVLASPETVFVHDLAQPMITLLGITHANHLILPLTLAFITAAVVAGILRITLLWAQTRLGFAIGADLSYEIYRRTLYQPYMVHVARNSSDIVAAITTKANQVVGGAINPVIILVSSVFTIIIILATLFAINPIIALSGMIGFSAIYGAIVLITKKQLLNNSQQVNSGANKVVKIVQEGLGGIRDILIDGTQSSYCKSYRAVDVPMRRAQANSHVISQIPRYGIEALTMALVAVIAYRMVDSSGGLVEALPILGAFALGVQRILPTLQLAYANYSTMRASQAILNDAVLLFEQEVSDVYENVLAAPLPFNDSITFRNLHFRYEANSSWVLNDINIDILKGQRVGFVGTTGSGKSTILDIVMGLLQPSKGTMVVDDNVIDEKNFRSWQVHIAHVPQTIFLVDASISENIAFGIAPNEIDYELVRKAASQAQIAETIESWELQYDTVVGERGVRLSGGQRQRIGIARALYKQADVLVFDEATSALDNETENSVMEAITSMDSKITVLMVAHRLTTLRNCDQIIEIDKGKVKRIGSYDEIVG